MEQKKIDRINELSRLQKTVGLSEAEKEEQAVLRREYIDLFKRNMRSTLETISIKEADGSITHVKDLRKDHRDE